MDNPHQSYLQPEQQSLFAAEELPAGHELLRIDEAAKAGRSTGERIAKDRARYQGIVQMIAEGVSLRRTARAWDVNVKTVMAIRDREQGSGAIGTLKKGIANNLRAFADSASERLLEEADDIPLKDLSIAMGIAIDKMQLLDGEATSRSEIVDRRVKLASFDDFIQELKPAQTTGLADQEKGAKGAPAAELESGLDPVQKGVTPDDRSGVNVPQTAQQSEEGEHAT